MGVDKSKYENEVKEKNIHLRASKSEKQIIEDAAKIVGVNKSTFILKNVIPEAKRILNEQD